MAGRKSAGQISLQLVLHAHLPYVKRPERPDALEHYWYYEAVLEAYLPLLNLFDALLADDLQAPLCLSLSPTLLSLMVDSRMAAGLEQRLAQQADLVEAQWRQASRADKPLFVFYRKRLERAREQLAACEGDLIVAFCDRADRAGVELGTTAATHAYLPLLQREPGSIHAQLEQGVRAFETLTGRAPAFFWLPECGYFPGLEHLLAGLGPRWTVLDAHAFTHASVQPRYGLQRPIRLGEGPVAFARDSLASQVVWDAQVGYPGDYLYREYHRDLAADFEAGQRPEGCELPDGTPLPSGLKLWRVSGPNEEKERYKPAEAAKRAGQHARDFVERLRVRAAEEGEQHVCVPFDAELFGHWWYEGPLFLEAVIRRVAKTRGLELVTGSTYLERLAEPPESCEAAASSWGSAGYHRSWLNERTDWLYPRLHEAGEQMAKLVEQYGDAADETSRMALAQAARSLLLAQASDWPFILRSGTTTELATERLNDHLARFLCVAEGLASGTLDAQEFQAIAILDDIFQGLDYMLFEPNSAGDFTMEKKAGKKASGVRSKRETGKRAKGESAKQPAPKNPVPGAADAAVEAAAAVTVPDSVSTPAPVAKTAKKAAKKAKKTGKSAAKTKADTPVVEPVPAAGPEAPAETIELVHHQPGPLKEGVPSMSIVQITPELAPVAKVGGLADVVNGLSRELEIRGNNVEIILPKYDCMRYDHIWGLCESFRDLWVPWYGGAVHCTVWFGFVHGRKCFFIEPHSNENFFNRGTFYGHRDDVLRFAFFSRAAIEFLQASGKQPDIIHCHDWQTGLVPVFLYEIYQHIGLWKPRVCYTIHNFRHQGVTGEFILGATGLNNPGHFCNHDRLLDNHNPHALNLMKGGIVYSNFVTTVSPKHAWEVRMEGQGFGLEPTLHAHHYKFGGVVNGVDYDVWNPEVDGHIPVHYTRETIQEKYANKKALRDRLWLADNEKPIVAFVGRLDPQKGLDLVRHAIFHTLYLGGQFILLGSSPEGGINNYFWELKGHLNDSQDCHIEIGFDEELAHLIYAGSDMMIVPSRYEPCGLTQLIAMRYGTIPIVRACGGLADTVIDKDYADRPLHERNGYVFENADNAGLESALSRAISCYYDFPEDFRELMKHAMSFDYSWNIPGQHYLNIYDHIRQK